MFLQHRFWSWKLEVHFNRCLKYLFMCGHQVMCFARKKCENLKGKILCASIESKGYVICNATWLN